MRRWIIMSLLLLTTGNILAQENAEQSLTALTDSTGNGELISPNDQTTKQPDDQMVTEICGIPFGTSYEKTREILLNKYGLPDYNPDRTIITYKKKIYADITFDNIHFLFQSDGVNSYFNGCAFVLKAKSAKDARRKRDYLRGKLARKYTLMNDEDDNGFKFYYGGKAPTAKDTFAFHIDVVKYEDGIYRWVPAYAARIAYGRYNYVDEEF